MKGYRHSFSASHSISGGLEVVAVEAARPTAVERPLGGRTERVVQDPAQQPQPELPLSQRKVSHARASERGVGELPGMMSAKI